MVYVLDRDGRPLMPTKRYGKVRHLLKDGKAVVVRKTPFTIQLTYNSERHKQPVSLGIDAGSKHIGLSATTERKELFSAQVELRQDINKLLVTRREGRRSRRSRKTRYRKPRFLNRTHCKKKGWLAPSVKAKCEAHVMAVKHVIQILPVTEIHVEMAPFDTQKLKADIEGMKRPESTDYQHGEQEGFDNIKAYVKFRDGYRCAVCGAEHVLLQVHHKIQHHNGGTDIPSNLITVCTDCHKAYHIGTLTGKKTKVMDPDGKIPRLKDAAFMGIMRWAVWDRLKELGMSMHMTFGHRTAEVRKQYNLSKNHRIDARCISSHPNAEPTDEYYFIKKVRCHNRQIYKMKVSKGGVRKRNQAEYEVKGFRLFDKVEYKGNRHYFIFGRRKTGIFSVRDMNGNKATKCGDISYRNLKLIEPQSGYMIDRIAINN